MRKQILLIILAVIIAAFCLHRAVNIVHDIKDVHESIENVYKGYVGQQFVLGDDTLIIVDYSTFNESFTLSNGVNVDYKLIIK